MRMMKTSWRPQGGYGELHRGGASKEGRWGQEERGEPLSPLLVLSFYRFQASWFPDHSRLCDYVQKLSPRAQGYRRPLPS